MKKYLLSLCAIVSLALLSACGPCCRNDNKACDPCNDVEVEEVDGNEKF